MHTFIAFLRGINLGNRRLKMDALRRHFEKMKFTEVTTFIASGNVIFTTELRDTQKLEAFIERQLKASLGYEVHTFVRTLAEIAAIVAFAPFTRDDMNSPQNTVHCAFFREPLAPAQIRGLASCRTEVDELRVRGRELYWLCRIKTNESKIWTLPEYKALKLPSSSMRNLKTLRKLAALYPVPKN
jgi:uncharacterized protein (DUF1697 family)